MKTNAVCDKIYHESHHMDGTKEPEKVNPVEYWARIFLFLPTALFWLVGVYLSMGGKPLKKHKRRIIKK